jgi:mannose-6-phosphate isomerase
MIERLHSHAVERPWGRTSLPAPFTGLGADGKPIGEIWFERADGGTGALLVKYLFTSQRLSIQVHPDDEAAQAAGLAQGKDEAWLVTDAAPGATIGIGLTRQVTPEALRAAALDGSIERLIDWRRVRKGDFFYSPAGTIHAIGAGVALVEIQQQSDVTYRLYDYGRPRALHLDEAMRVAKPEPFQDAAKPTDLGLGRKVLASGGKFVVELWEPRTPVTFDAGEEELILMPLRDGLLGEDRAMAGEVWSATGQSRLRIDRLLVAYAGGRVRRAIWPTWT